MARHIQSFVFRGLGALVGVLALCAALVFAISEWKLRRTHDAPLVSLRKDLAADPAAGEHMAKVVGCWAGCHGPAGEGGFDVVGGIHRTTAPTLSQVLPSYNDEQLVRLIRYGVKRDGRSAVGMYPATLWHLADQDLANIIAHLRRQPLLPPVPRSTSITWRGRVALVSGEWQVSADQVDRSRPRWGELPRRTSFERGRYLASIVCSECHGADFGGDTLEGGPSLAIVAAYGADQFRELMRTGRPLDGRDIPKMRWMADVDFTDEEIDDIRGFLCQHHGVEKVCRTR